MNPTGVGSTLVKIRSKLLKHAEASQARVDQRSERMRQLEIRFSFGIVMASILLSGCNMTTIPSNRSIDNIESHAEARSVIREGMTMEEVHAKLGEPNHKATMNDQIVWSYTKAEINMNPFNTLFATGIPDTKSLAVTFNTKGRVVRVDFSETTNR